MKLVRRADFNTFIELYNRSVRLLVSIHRIPTGAMHRRDRSLARNYNDLRGDVIQAVVDQHLVQLVPGPVWCLEIWHVALGIAGLGTLIGLASLSDSTSVAGVGAIAVIGTILAALGGLLTGSSGAPWKRSDPWYWKASPVSMVAERTTRLVGFLGDYLEERSPGITDPPHNDVDSEWKDDPQEIVLFAPSSSTGATAGVTDSERRHLEIQFQEQRTRYDQLTARIAAITADLGREMDSERELILKDRLEKLSDEREQVQTLLKTIERALNENQTVE